MKTRITSLLFAFILASLSGLLAQTTRYVNPDGNCGGNTPCYTTIQAAVNAAVAGDVVQIEAASHYVATAITVDKAITIQGEGDGSLVLRQNPGTYSVTFEFADAADGAVIKDLKINGHDGFTGPATSSSYPNGYVINITGNAENITVKNITFEHGRSAVLIYGDNATIRDCRFIGYWMRGLLRPLGCQNVLITGNIADTKHYQYGLIYAHDALSSGEISYNYVACAENPNYFKSSGNVFDMEFYDGFDGSIIHNTFDTQRNFSNTTNGSVYPNYWGIYFESPPAGNAPVIKDNIFVGYEPVLTGNPDCYAIVGPPDAIIDNNLFYDTQYTSWPSGTNEIIADPQFSRTGDIPEYYSFGFGSPAYGTASDGTCVGAYQLLPVHNITQDLYYLTIQEAINDADPGDVIEAAAGTYNEDIVIGIPITLNGANKNITPCTGARGPESVLQPFTSGAAAVSLGAGTDNVIINGFEITGTLSNNAIYCGLNGPSYLDIKFNYIHHIGVDRGSGNVYAINYRGSANNTTDINISDNCIDEVFNTTSLAQKSSAAIWLGQSTATGTVSNVTIERNTISNIKSDINKKEFELPPYEDVGKITTSGIYIGVAWKNPTGNVTGALIKDNTITNIIGGIAYGIQLTGNTPGLNIENNFIYDINSPVAPSYEYGIGMTASNHGTLSTVTNNNSITNILTGISNTSADLMDATCNWWGQVSGPLPGQVSGPVDYAPWLISGIDNDPGTIGFQPVPGSCGGFPVINLTTGVGYATIQGAVDEALSGHVIQIFSGTYIEDVTTAGVGGLTFVPGTSPGCVTISGDLTLTGLDILDMEVWGTTPCTEHDEFIVTGNLTWGGATVNVILNGYDPAPGTEFTLFESAALSGFTPVVVYSGMKRFQLDVDPLNTNNIVLTTLEDAAIDVAVHEIGCAGFEVALRPNYNPGDFTITNVQFTIKYPETVELINVDTASFGFYTGYSPAPPAGFKYVTYVALGLANVGWVAGEEYAVLTFSHDQSGTTPEYGDFEIVPSTDPNIYIKYYAEVLGLDVTGTVFANALNSLLTGCPVWNATQDLYYYQIQPAMDDPLAQTNDWIQVLIADVYEENVMIATDGITLQGMVDNVVIAPNATDAGNPLSTFDGSPQLGIMVTADNVTLNHLTIDGSEGTYPDGFRVGILNYDASNNFGDYLTVNDVEIYNTIRRGIALWPEASTGHTVTGCDIAHVGYQQGISCSASSVNITGNSISYAGMAIGLYPNVPAASTITLTVTDNIIHHIAGSYSGYYGTSWPSVAIYYRNPSVDQTVVITGNDISIGNGPEPTGMDWGVTGMYIYNADAGSLIQSNTIDATGGEDNTGIYLGGCAGTTVRNNLFELNDTDRGIFLGRGSTGAPVPNIITFNTLNSTGSSGSELKDSYGIAQSDHFAGLFFLAENPHNTDNLITNNVITGFRNGVLLYADGSNTLDATINSNKIVGNTLFGIEASTLSADIDATCNWWGSDDINVVGTMVNGSHVVYIPFLINDLENVPPAWTYGFDPVGPCQAPLPLQVMLQGPYDETLGEMAADLNAAGMIPNDQPFNEWPWFYAGTETLPSPLPAEVVDWVLIELRETETTPGTIRVAGLLYEDGSVEANFTGIDQMTPYYIVIHHRNHLPVMSASAINLGTFTFPYDFTDLTNVYSNGAILIDDTPDDVYGMIAGDVTHNGMLKYSGADNDRGPIIALIVTNTGSPLLQNIIWDGYYFEDVNMNDTVRYVGAENDRDKIIANIIEMTGQPFLNYTYTTVVPGAYYGSKDGKSSDGPLHLAIREAGDRIELVLQTNEAIKNGFIDNIQFTLAWNVGDMEIAKMVDGAESLYNINPQGDGFIYEEKRHIVFVGVTPVFLPQTFLPGDELVVMTLPRTVDSQIAGRLKIAEDEMTEEMNGLYYVSVCGKDMTGYVKSTELGMEELNAGSIRIYPNPVSDGTLNILLPEAMGQKVQITLTGMQGQAVLEQNCEAAGVIQLDVSRLNGGVYLLNIRGEKTVHNSRVVIR